MQMSNHVRRTANVMFSYARNNLKHFVYVTLSRLEELFCRLEFVSVGNITENHMNEYSCNLRNISHMAQRAIGNNLVRLFHACWFVLLKLVVPEVCVLRVLLLIIISSPTDYSDATWALCISDNRQVNCLFSSLLRLTNEITPEFCINVPSWGESSGNWETCLAKVQ